jgi:hypothetical protein
LLRKSKEDADADRLAREQELLDFEDIMLENDANNENDDNNDNDIIPYIPTTSNVEIRALSCLMSKLGKHDC